LDAALTVLANGCYRWLASELHGFAVSKPKRVCRKIIETGGTVRITDDHIHVHFQKRAHNLILRQAALDTKAGGIPWAGGLSGTIPTITSTSRRLVLKTSSSAFAGHVG
jgi:hypothetical protein